MGGLRKARAEKAGKTSKADEAKKAPVIVNKKDEDENASKEEEKDLENDDAEDKEEEAPKKQPIFKKSETPAEKMQRRRDGLRKARAEKAGKTSKADEAKKG